MLLFVVMMCCFDVVFDVGVDADFCSDIVVMVDVGVDDVVVIDVVDDVEVDGVVRVGCSLTFVFLLRIHSSR